MQIQEVLKVLKESWAGPSGLDDVSAFDSLEDALGQPLPADYKFFLMWSNGGESLKPLLHYRFYSLHEIVELRGSGQPPAVLEVATDDSNGIAFDLAIHRDTGQYPVVRYPLGDTDRSGTEAVSRNFVEFLGDLLETSR